MARGACRVAASASSMCRSHMRAQKPGAMPLRSKSEATTASGLRSISTYRVAMFRAARSSVTNGTNREIRGSLSTNKEEAPYSSSINTRKARAASSRKDGDKALRSSLRQSSQLLSICSSKRSCCATSDAGSQWPRTLLGDAPNKVLGKSAPSRLMTRAMAEVPLRCMPRTNRQMRCGKAPTSPWLGITSRCTTTPLPALSRSRALPLGRILGSGPQICPTTSLM